MVVVVGVWVCLWGKYGVCVCVCVCGGGGGECIGDEKIVI